MKHKDFSMGRFYHADCFEAMRELRAHSVDMILCDLPYGTTQNKWDSVLPLERLWAEYWRVAKPNAAVVLTAQAPFDKLLGASCLRHLKYEWIWEKFQGTGHLNAKKQPMKCHENVLVFYQEQCIYVPQMVEGKPYTQASGRASTNYGAQVSVVTENKGERYPRSVIKIAHDKNTKIHPTQKPVALFEYLIKTYTNEGALVLDNTAGSGTTAIAAINTNRYWICVDADETYYNKAVERIKDHISQRSSDRQTKAKSSGLSRDGQEAAR
jgi:site-specific DNA-methyltransferase (adenine-specific)